MNYLRMYLSRLLGWTQEQIADAVKLSRNRISEIVGNTKLGKIDTLLSHGHDMEYAARHYNLDLALAWALRLEGKTDQERFKELGLGLRPWDAGGKGLHNSKRETKGPAPGRGFTLLLECG